MENNITKAILILLLFSGAILAQQDTTQNSAPDSLETKSPIGAVLRSAVIPGWGQIYNESYWKAPVVWGFIGYFIYVWIDNHNKYHESADSLEFYRDRYSLSNNARDLYYRNYYKTARDFYHDQRDLFAIYIGIAYVLNLLDAYVDAHLFNFNVDEDMLTRMPRLKVQYNFNSIFP